MLKTRVITAIFLITAFIPALFLSSDIVWAALALVVCLFSMYEWGKLIKLKPSSAIISILLFVCIGAWMLFHVGNDNYHLLSYRALIVFAMTAAFWLMLAPIWLIKRFEVKSKVLMVVLGILLFTSFLLALILARKVDPWLLLILLGIIWIADIAAYFSGKQFGKNKLAPMISPGKTWEGVFGALIAVSIFAAILYFWFDVKELVIFPAFWIVAILGIKGDLFESLLKRQANLKDSGNILPGHGGILDRIDGLMPSLPIAILMIYFYHYFKAAS